MSGKPGPTEAVFARVDGGADELHRSTAYYWDNSKRKESNRINLQLTIAGECFFENEQGRFSVPVGKLIAFTQRENSRYGYPATATAPYRLRYLSIDPSATATPLFNRLRQDFGSVLSMPEGSESANAFNELFRRFQEGSFLDLYQESELITRLFTATYRQQVEETQKTDPIEYGYHLLQSRYSSPITLKDISKLCGLSREHFIRSFTRRFGYSPGSLLRRLRYDYARSLLLGTDLPLETVATRSGFTSANVFCRSFRNAFGLTPNAFRDESKS